MMVMGHVSTPHLFMWKLYRLFGSSTLPERKIRRSSSTCSPSSGINVFTLRVLGWRFSNLFYPVRFGLVLWSFLPSAGVFYWVALGFGSEENCNRKNRHELN
jgi:hypothetical protein